MTVVLEKIPLNASVTKREASKIFRNISKTRPWSPSSSSSSLHVIFLQMVRRIQLGMFTKRHINRSLYSQGIDRSICTDVLFPLSFRLNTMLIHRTSIILAKMMLGSRLMIWLVGTKNFNQEECEDRPAQSPLCICPLLLRKFQTMNKCVLYRRRVLCFPLISSLSRSERDEKCFVYRCGKNQNRYATTTSRHEMRVISEMNEQWTCFTRAPS